MKALLPILAVLLTTGCSSYQPENGDIIFQTSLSSQSRAIQLATHSVYSHMGIVYATNGKAFVLEASNVVKLTPLKKWIERGNQGKYAVKRLKERQKYLSPVILNKMMEHGNKYLGKPYDIYFQWDDERMYCSELVWKIYKNSAGLEIGNPEHLRDFDLSNAAVKQILLQRYGDSIPLDEAVISPEAMFESNLLKQVYTSK